jgi:hypothetical protein
VASEPFEKPLDIIGPFNKVKYKRLDSERTINMYEVLYDRDGQRALFSFPGYKKAITLPGVTVTRVSLVNDGFMYWVCGDGVFKIGPSLVPSQIGTLTTFSGHVGIAANANQIIFVDGAFGYIYTKATGVFQRITDAAFPPLPSDVADLDGFFFVSQGNSPTFFQSAANNGLVWNSQAFASITTRPDIIVALAVLNRRLFVFGNTVTEVWYNAGSSPVTLQRDNNLVLNYGCASADTVEVDYGYLFFMAAESNGPNQVMVTDGTIPRKISNPNMENEISNYKAPNDAFSTLFKLEGQLFYILSFTTDQRTWVYNLTTGGMDWCEAEELPDTRHIMQTQVYYQNKHYIGSYKSGDIYALSDKYFDNDGVTMRRQRISQRFYDPRYRKISVDRLEVDCLKGLGRAGLPSANPDDYDPVLFLYVSNDGGYTYSAKKPESVGEVGKYRHRIVFTKLGSYYDFVFKFEYYNRSDWALIGASWRGTIENR